MLFLPIVVFLPIKLLSYSFVNYNNDLTLNTTISTKAKNQDGHSTYNSNAFGGNENRVF